VKGTRTKIICTIGPSVSSVESMMELMLAGMNVARLNFSHGTHQEHLEMILRLKEAREKLGIPLAIMLDTKGPEIRVGKLENGEVYLPPKHLWHLVDEPIIGNAVKATILPSKILKNLKVGTTVLFDNGYILSKVVETTENGVVVQIENGGVIKSSKGVNIPNFVLDIPAMTEKDIEDIRFGCKNDVDIIAASFIRSADHVVEIKELLNNEQQSPILVIAKIESGEGVKNFDQIVQVADGIMIARGDLGVELPLSQVPKLQKMMIKKCINVGKPAIIATQMLETMMYNTRPTRAETSDVANAIYESTSAVMLSGETAVGQYPIETVHVMRSIIEETESDFDYNVFFEKFSSLSFRGIPSAVALATVKTANSTDAKAIFVYTSTGATARILSRFRPQIPIIAMTPSKKCYYQLAFTWGVIPFLAEDVNTPEQAFERISKFALDRKLVEYGDLVVVIAGVPFGITGTTNMMFVESIGEVWVRGQKGIGSTKQGIISILLSPESKKPFEVRQKFLVINRCDATYKQHIIESSGIVLDNALDDTDSEKYLLEIAERHGKSAILRAEGASRILREEAFVTLDPEKGIVTRAGNIRRM